MTDYTPIGLYFGLVVLVTSIVLGFSVLFPPRRPPSPLQRIPYESGICTEAHLFGQRVTMRHYLIALLFLIFDVEVIFFYPWAVVAKQIGPFAFYELLLFIVPLAVAFAYAWRKGGLQWE